MSGGHDHGRSHGGGDGGLEAAGRLTAVLLVTLTIMLAEVVGGLLSHSLVLLADVAHMTADAAGVGLSLLAACWALRPKTSRRTFGYERAEILAAVLNAVLLLVLGLLVLVEAVRRLADPGQSSPEVMVVLGVVAVVGNGASLLLLTGGQARSLNVRGACLEVLSDLFGAGAVLVAAGG